ncbi:MAG TPA: amidohydrolase family protein [Gemmatimonadaceae bacterium]|nr:amidohydrolase family protein [Gemmatimonadaceae bacterium]
MTTTTLRARLRGGLLAAALAAPLAAPLAVPVPAAAQAARQGGDGAPITQPVWPATLTQQIAPGTVQVPRGSVVIRNLDSLWTATGQVLTHVSVLVRDGKIRAIGPSVDAPAGVPVIDGAGLTAIPGIVDTHSHSAMATWNEGTSAVVPEVRVVDVLRPESLEIYQALSGGVTTSVILHGSANPIGGQSAIIKMRWGMDDPLKLMVQGAPRTVKFALGENVTRKNGNRGGVQRYPASREGVEALYVQAFTAAQAYRKAWQDYRKNPSAFKVPPRRDLRLEALVDILEGRINVIAHSYRSDEIVMLLGIADRFGFKIDLLTHVLEGYKVADEIAAHGAGASTFSDWWQYKLEAFDAIPYNAAILHEHGVLTSLNSDSPWLQATMVMEFNKPVKYGGVSKEEALRMLTAYPARQIHLEDRIGTLEVGKDGDIVLLSGDPFDSYSRVEKTIVDGIVYYDRTNERATRQEPVRTLAALPLGSAPPPGDATGARAQGDGMAAAGPAAAAPRAALPLAPNQPVTALVGATVHPVSGPPIPNGVVLVQGGKIMAVGPAAAVQVPAGATRVDLAGKQLYPGMIEPFTQLGMIEIGAVPASRDDEEVGDFNPHVRALAGVHPHSTAIPVARANGITAVMDVVQGAIIDGAGSVVQLAGDTPARMSVDDRAVMVMELPDASGNAWDPPKLEGEKLEATVRLLERAQHFAEGGHIAENPTAPFQPQAHGSERVLLESLVPVVTGQMPVFFRAHTEREIRTVFLLLDRFPRMKGVIVGGDQAYRVAAELARRRIPVIIGSEIVPTMDEDDPITAGWENAARLHRAGVTVAFTTQFGENTTDVRNLPYHAARAVAYGLPQEVALRAVTLTAAELIGQGDAMGSIEPGKRADLIVTDGDPLQIVTNVERVWIDGQEVSTESKHTRLYEQFKDRD